MPKNTLLERKRKKWVKRNSIKLNQQYISKVLKLYQIEYKFIQGKYNDYDILIIFILDKYRIEVDYENMSYNLVIVTDLENNPKHKNRYKLVQIFEGEDLIINVVKYLNNINNKSDNHIQKEIV